MSIGKQYCQALANRSMTPGELAHCLDEPNYSLGAIKPFDFPRTNTLAFEREWGQRSFFNLDSRWETVFKDANPSYFYPAFDINTLQFKYPAGNIPSFSSIVVPPRSAANDAGPAIGPTEDEYICAISVDEPGLEKVLEPDRASTKSASGHMKRSFSAARSLKSVYGFLRDLLKGGTVAFYFKQINGQYYIIFKGNQRLREIVAGTRYRIDTKTVAKLKLTFKEARETFAKDIRFNFVVLGAGLTTEVLAAAFFGDPFTWNELSAHGIVSTVFAGIGWAAAPYIRFAIMQGGMRILTSAAAAAVAAAFGTTIVLGSGGVLLPIVISFFISWGISEALSYFDKEYRYTDRLSLWLKTAAEVPGQMLDRAYLFIESVERDIYSAYQRGHL